jgi:Lon protease-like protein
MPKSADDPSLARVSLFPLPNVVLFPRAILPLHIFEDRYKQMMADALCGDRRIAMALLRPGWERNYYQAPEIEPVVCIGAILSHERLADGKYNLLLQGQTRARIVKEQKARPYRTARLRAIEETPMLEIDLEQQRGQLLDLFSRGPLASSSAGRQFRELFDQPIPTAGLADLAAFHFIDDISLKQQLLAEEDVGARIRAILEALPAMVGQYADPHLN